MSSRTEELATLREHFHLYFDLEPELGGKFLDHYESTYREGVFDAKTKRLMALCGGIAAGCKGCILGQTDFAIAEGATAEEILAVCSIAMSLGGTMAGSQITMVVELLREKGMI